MTHHFPLTGGSYRVINGRLVREDDAGHSEPPIETPPRPPGDSVTPDPGSDFTPARAATPPRGPK